MFDQAESSLLLERYALTRDPAAFNQLVGRYINLVFSAALRRVGDRHLAEDIAQAVFLILARKAKSISSTTPLSSWLLTTVRYASANAMKIERRQKRRILESAEMQTEACSANPSNVLIWQEVAGEIDDAILKLSALDRAAVLGRYFENQPLASIAQQMKVSEGAIKQRLGRALEKLRDRLQRRGVSLDALPGGAVLALSSLLEANVVRIAPAGLVNQTCTAVVSGGVKLTAAIHIAKGAMTMMRWTQTKVAAAMVAAVMAGGAGSAWTISHARAQAEDQTRAEPTATAPPAKKKSTPMSLTKAPPVIVSTTPRAGEDSVDPNLTEIKITYSKDMQDGSWSWAQMSDDSFPKSAGKIHYEDDARTCVMPVKLESDHTYVLMLNIEPFTNFIDQDGHKAMPYMLVFKTKAQ